MADSPFNCPNCKAETTQSIPMLFQTGVQHGSSSTAMSGVGFSRGGLGVAVGSATTQNSTSMALIRKYKMPLRPRVNDARQMGGWLLLVFGVCMVITAYASSSVYGCSSFFALVAFIWGGILIATYPGHKLNITKQQGLWDERRDYLGTTWVCFRCGNEWQPGQ